MVVSVIVTGVPRLMALKDLAVEFNEVLDHEDIGDFRVRDVDTYSNKSSKRQIALEFESSFDAMTVQEKLDGFEFITSGGSCNIIKAKIWTASDEPEAEPGSEVVISTTSRRDYYEQSVEDVNESLNVQIDLLRKQTLALKAQRKFLREQKKLKKEYTKLDKDSDDETLQRKKSRKRKRFKSANSDSSGSDDRPKSRDKHRSPKSFDRRKRSRSPRCDDYLAIEYKKISTTRRSKSPEVRTRFRSIARSKSREIPPRKSEPYKRRSRSREKYSAIEYKMSTKMRKSNSPKPQTSSHRIVRSKSRERHRSPPRISGSHRRRSRSRTREKYYSVETIEYKKALLTRSPKSKSKYERTEQCVLTSKCSKLRRSPSPYKADLRSKNDPHKRKIPRSRSRSRSPFKRKLTDSSSKSYRNRSPSTRKRALSPNEKISDHCEKPRSKYYNESCPKPEFNSSQMLDSKWKTSKATEKRESLNREDRIELNAEIQSKKKQAMEDVLFEMELLLRKERNNTISNADKTFLTNLVKGIVKSRFQKLEVHDRMMVSDVVTCYRSQYSKEDDRTLLRNLAEECKSLDEVTSTVVADSTAEVPSPQSQNDEIWTAVDEALDGVDLDLLQAEPEPNQVEVSENPEKESQMSSPVQTVKVNSINADVPHDIEETQINSTSETLVAEINTNRVAADPIQAKILYKAKHNTINLVDLTSDLKENANENITSSGIPLAYPKPPDLTKDTRKNAVEDDIAVPIKTHVNDTKVPKVVKVKTEPIELSDDSGSEMDDSKQINVTSTISQEHIASDKSFCTGHIIEVKSLAKVKPIEQNNISTPVKKVCTVDLTEETDETEQKVEQTNTALSDTHLLKSIKKENEPTDIIDSTTRATKKKRRRKWKKKKKSRPNHTYISNDQSNVALLSLANLLSYIKQDKFDMNSIIISDDEEIGTNDQRDIPIFDPNVVKSIKQEQVATEEDISHDKCGKLSESIILSSIKQEPGTAEMDLTHHSGKPEINNEQLQNTLPDKSIKKELETTVTNDLTSRAAESEINKHISNKIIPVTKIASCVKQENDAIVDDSISQSNVTNINQINMPRTINLSGIKQEPLATDDDSISQSEVTDINNDQITMPVPIIQTSVKHEDTKIVNTDSTSQCDAQDISKDQSNIPMPVPIMFIKKENVNTGNSGSKGTDKIETNKQYIITPEASLSSSIKKQKATPAVSDYTISNDDPEISSDSALPVPKLTSSINKALKSVPKDKRKEEATVKSKTSSKQKVCASAQKDSFKNTKKVETFKGHSFVQEKEQAHISLQHKNERDGSTKCKEIHSSIKNKEEIISLKKQNEMLSATNQKEINTNSNLAIRFNLFISKLYKLEKSEQPKVCTSTITEQRKQQKEPNNQKKKNLEIKLKKSKQPKVCTSTKTEQRKEQKEPNNQKKENLEIKLEKSEQPKVCTSTITEQRKEQKEPNNQKKENLEIKLKKSEQPKVCTSTLTEQRKEQKEPNNQKKENLEINNRPLPENPQFVVPTHIIMRQYKALIKNKYDEHKYMYQITRKVLQNRFLELVKDKGYVKAKNIARMYRYCYAEEKYEDFLGGISADIKAGKYDEDIRKLAMQEMGKQNETNSKEK